jgi:phosphotriesterase-related protein
MDPAIAQMQGKVMTVLGPVAADSSPGGGLAPVLPHEHILVDFIGAEQASPTRYDADEVFAVSLPHLERLRAAGGRTLVECTPAGLGRDPALMARLSRASGLHILTNTGYYGSGQNKFVPADGLTATAAELAAKWKAEAREGIDGTGVRPGFIKISVDPGPLSALHR